jgi:hypothetical protein
MTGKGRHSRRGRWVGFVTVVVFVSVATLTLSANAFGQEEEPKEDVKGSQDHPLISRFPNSVILAYDQQEYDELVLILGGIDWGPNLRPHPSKSQKVEGKTTRILYLAPPSKTTLEIMRNMQPPSNRRASRCFTPAQAMKVAGAGNLRAAT